MLAKGKPIRPVQLPGHNLGRFDLSIEQWAVNSFDCLIKINMEKNIKGGTGYKRGIEFLDSKTAMWLYRFFWKLSPKFHCLLMGMNHSEGKRW